MDFLEQREKKTMFKCRKAIFTGDSTSKILIRKTSHRETSITSILVVLAQGKERSWGMQDNNGKYMLSFVLESRLFPTREKNNNSNKV